MQLRVENLRKEYREANGELRIIDGLTMEFPIASSMAILGRSGVGKSTLLHLLGGLDTPTSGKVLYDDIDLFSLSSEKLTQFRGAHIGFIFQFHHLLPEFDALENVAMPIVIAGGGEALARERAHALLAAVGLENRLTHRPSQLSGGEQQRVAIARALVTYPSVVLADEPTGNLDVHTATEVQQLLLSVCQTHKTTLIVVTHNGELAASLGNRFEMGVGGVLKPL